MGRSTSVWIKAEQINGMFYNGQLIHIYVYAPSVDAMFDHTEEGMRDINLVRDLYEAFNVEQESAAQVLTYRPRIMRPAKNFSDENGDAS